MFQVTLDERNRVVLHKQELAAAEAEEEPDVPVAGAEEDESIVRDVCIPDPSDSSQLGLSTVIRQLGEGKPRKVAAGVTDTSRLDPLLFISADQWKSLQQVVIREKPLHSAALERVVQRIDMDYGMRRSNSLRVDCTVGNTNLTIAEAVTLNL